jgi:hypothetical protein
MKSKDPVAYILITGHGTKIVDKKPFCEVDLWQGLYLESFVRQQQTEIEELKALLVKEQDESFDRTASHMAGEYVSYQAELTDEEIEEVAKSVEDESYARWKYEFAKEILKRAQEK